MTDAPTASAGAKGSNSHRSSPGAAVSPRPQAELEPVEVRDDEEDDNDSAIASSSNASSTTSISSSILQYRSIQGRTYHSERYNTDYFTPNDEQQRDSIDITHHYLTLLLDGKLFLAPLKRDIQKVLDIGTGTGIWAIDMADEFPNATVIGTDLSPIQPTWVPPNVMFELEDATETWSWPDNDFDFVHIRYLIGAVADWGALFKEAFRCCKPGGYFESGEVNPTFYSDNKTTDENTGMQTWNNLYVESSKKFGRSFCNVENDEELVREAGFVDVQVFNYKVPVGGWTKDKKLSEVGQFMQSTIENDLEGYTLMAWHSIMNWPDDEYQIFLMEMRKALKNKRIHGYMHVRYIIARKPEATES